MNIQDLKFVIPDGYKHNESEDSIGVEADESLPYSYVTKTEFDNDDDSIIIKVVYSDEIEYNDDTYDPANTTVEKEINKQKGYYEKYADGVMFDYCVDGKLVEIFAPNEEVLTSLLG